MKLRTHLIIGTLLCTVIYFAGVHKKGCGSLLDEWREAIEEKQPEMVLIGNSMLRAGVDEDALSQATGWSVEKSYSNGSASAWWYLYVKNVLGKTQHCPRVAVIFFRDHFLTDPDFRIDGPYAEPIRTISESDEPVLKTVLGPHLSFWDSPLTWLPQAAKRYWDGRAMKASARVMGVSRGFQQRSMAAVFDEERMIPELITQQQLASEQCSEGERCDFAARVEASFLPLILEELDSRGIRPVFVRIKRRRDVDPEREPAALKPYLLELQAYLEARGARLYDFSHEDSILEEHYGPGDHLNPTGQALFTALLADTLQPAL